MAEFQGIVSVNDFSFLSGSKNFCKLAGTHVYNPHLLDNRSTSSSVRKAGALVSPSSCLDGEPHGWVPVDTHSTPVPSSTGEAVGGLCSI